MVYLQTVFDERLGIVEPLEQDLGSSHGHLGTRQEVVQNGRSATFGVFRRSLRLT